MKLPEIDAELDRVDHDAASKMIDAMSPRVAYIVYQALYNGRGIRIVDAPHMIRQLAPRKPERK